MLHCVWNMMIEESKLPDPKPELRGVTSQCCWFMSSILVISKLHPLECHGLALSEHNFYWTLGCVRAVGCFNPFF